jgi:hypothetical protein
MFATLGIDFGNSCCKLALAQKVNILFLLFSLSVNLTLTFPIFRVELMLLQMNQVIEQHQLLLDLGRKKGNFINQNENFRI